MSTNFVQKATGASPTGLTDSLVFDDGTSVGIGTTTPSLGQLHIKNTAGHAQFALQSADAAQAEIRIRKVSGDAGWSIYKPANSLDLRFWDGVDRVAFQSGGNVGIGTTSPDARLHVNTTEEEAMSLHVSAVEGSKIRFDGGDNLRLEILGSDSTLMIGDINSQSDPRIDFYSSGHGSSFSDLDVRIVAPGQNWQGTGNNLLRVLAQTLEIRYLGTSESRRSFRWRLDDSDNSNDPRYTGIVSLNKNDGGKTVLEFAVDSSELQPGNGIKMKLDEDGALTLTEGQAVIGTSGASTTRVLKFRDSGGSSLVQHQAGGGLLLCTDDSDLSPGNGVRVRIEKTALSANSALYIGSDGVTLTTTAPSAREYKRDIEEFVPDVSRLFDLRLKSFTWKSTGEADCGFLAEDIESHIPELFRRGETVTGWKADRFPLYLFQALKDLNRRVAAIESATRS